MRKAVTHLVLTSVAAISIPVAAQGIEHREDRQQDRIDQGVASGELTHHEAARVEHRQARLVRTEDRMRWRNGGYLTHHQRVHLHHMANRNSRVIHRLKNNDRTD